MKCSSSPWLQWLVGVRPRVASSALQGSRHCRNKQQWKEKTVTDLVPLLRGPPFSCTPPQAHPWAFCANFHPSTFRNQVGFLARHLSRIRSDRQGLCRFLPLCLPGQNLHDLWALTLSPKTSLGKGPPIPAAEFTPMSFKSLLLHIRVHVKPYMCIFRFLK